MTSDRDPLASFLVGFCMLAAGVVSAAGLAIAFAGDYFPTFVDLPAPLVAVVFLLLFVFLSANVSVLVLRRDRVEHDHFREWTVIPILGIASCVLLLTQQSGTVWLFGAILLAIGAVLFAVTRWVGRRSRSVKR